LLCARLVVGNIAISASLDRTARDKWWLILLMDVKEGNRYKGKEERSQGGTVKSAVDTSVCQSGRKACYQVCARLFTERRIYTVLCRACCALNKKVIKAW